MLTDALLLAALRGEYSLEAVSRTAGVGEAEFRRERDAYLRRSRPPNQATWQAGITAPVDIWRDRHGIPHIYAASTTDLFFGLAVGFEPELGYFSLSELRQIRGKLGLPVERDKWFRGAPLRELAQKHGATWAADAA